MKSSESFIVSVPELGTGSERIKDDVDANNRKQGHATYKKDN